MGLPMNWQVLQAVADRLELQDLVSRWAQAVDRRSPTMLASLLCPDGEFIVPRGDVDAPPLVITPAGGQLSHALDLLPFTTSTHLIGHHLARITGDRAEGETSCLAHEITRTGSEQHMRTVALRYDDTYIRLDGHWLFRRRRLHVEWRSVHSLQVALDSPY